MTEAGDEKLRAAFAALGSSDAYDAGATALPCGLYAVGGGERLCGYALTVHLSPGDNLGLQAAATRAQPGDVIVAVGGGEECALVGELLSLRAKVRGAVGIVVDGFARDARALALPVFARGTCPRKPRRQDFLSLGQSVDLLGLRIKPKDLVLADEDGIVLVPRQEARDILARAKAVLADNERTRRAIEQGEDLSWLETALRKAPSASA
ncbi:MAG: RraA family protein [Thermaerobacter sp.]|nr:RraA family protein [Thermaerobacter sp.]